MKKTFMIVALALTAMVSEAQISKGTIAAGGSFNFDRTGTSVQAGSISVQGPSYTFFELTPRVLYYLSDNLAVGGEIGFVMQSQKQGTASERTSVFTLAPMARYNLPVTERFGLFVDGRMGFGFGGTKETVGNRTEEGPSVFRFDLGVSPGMLYFLNEKIAIEARFGRLGYSAESQTETETYGNTTSTFKSSSGNFILNLKTTSLGFGFLYYIN
jgi:hypothetical protein